MTEFGKSDEPRTFRQIARMPERMKGDEIVLGVSFLFDPFIIAQQLQEQREALAARAQMHQVDEIPVQVQAEVDHFSDVA